VRPLTVFELARWRAALSLLLVVAAGFAFADVEPKRILIVHSFGRDSAPFATVASTFRSELIRVLRRRPPSAAPLRWAASAS
jgi:hypothetical protein